jgi:hypothetical protein
MDGGRETLVKNTAIYTDKLQLLLLLLQVAAGVCVW